ncbi:MAG: hypothetical protein CL873_04150, partial [Dehalococcoidales bacterium]|nr:hypothetical protein [Dehalococcoidales bacterium]
MIESFIANLASLLPFGYAFGAGMVTAVSPCGIAMLPAYVSLHLSSEGKGYAVTTGLIEVLQRKGIDPKSPSSSFLKYRPLRWLWRLLSFGLWCWDKSSLRRGARALVMSGVVTLGFVAFFGIMGAILSAGGQFVVTYIPWVAVLIGVALILLGIYLLAG